MDILTSALRCVVDSCAELKPTGIHPCQDVTRGIMQFRNANLWDHSLFQIFVCALQYGQYNKGH
jgi:hypothetical protein